MKKRMDIQGGERLMGMSNYYQDLRNKVGSDLIFMPSGSNRSRRSPSGSSCPRSRSVGGEHHPIDSETAELRYFSLENKPELALPYPESIFIKSDSEKAEFQWHEEWL